MKKYGSPEKSEVLSKDQAVEFVKQSKKTLEKIVKKDEKDAGTGENSSK